MAGKKKNDFDVNRFTGTADDTAKGKQNKKGQAARNSLNKMISGGGTKGKAAAKKGKK